MPHSRSARILFTVFVAVALLAIGRNLYFRYVNGALIAAVKARNVSATRSLLAWRANADTRESSAFNRGEGSNGLSSVLGTGTYSSDALSDSEEAIACLLIEHGADIGEKSERESCLEAACRRGSLAVMRCLLERGASLNYVDINHDTPIFCVINYNLSGTFGKPFSPAEQAARRRIRSEMVQLLNAHGVHLTLWQAAKADDMDSLRTLLDAGANVNAGEPDPKRSSGAAPLQLAAEQGNVEAVRLLLARGADVNAPAGKDFSTHSAPPLTLAISNDYADVFRLLLAHGANINAGAENGPMPPLEAAVCKAGASERPNAMYLQELLRRKADVNGGNGAPLRAALNVGAQDSSKLHALRLQTRLAVVRELLRHGARVNAPLRDASEEAGAKPDARGLSLRAGKTASVPGTGQASSAQRTVLASDGERFWHIPIAPPARPDSPLMLAARCFPQSVSLLLAAGADARPDSKRLLLAAAENQHAELYLLLLAHGAEVNVVGTNGETPLTLSIAQSPDSVRLLLERGANPNVITNLGETPLSRAVKAGNVDVVRLLLAHGANASARSPRSHVPLYWAHRHGHEEIIALLKRAGAKEE